MIGIVLIAHARIAAEMLEAAEHVLGKQPLIATLNVEDSDRPDQLQDDLTKIIRQIDTGDGVIILADMFGGTPCNVALSCAEPSKTEVLSGFNLPALIKAISMRQESPDIKTLARDVAVAGQQYICLASDYLDQHGSNRKKSDEVRLPDA